MQKVIRVAKWALAYAKFGVALGGVAVIAADEAFTDGGSYQTVAIAVGTAVFVFLTKNKPPAEPDEGVDYS